MTIEWVGLNFHKEEIVYVYDMDVGGLLAVSGRIGGKSRRIGSITFGGITLISFLLGWGRIL